MVSELGEMAHQDCHPFLHTLGLESYHPSLVPEGFRDCSKTQKPPHHPPFGSRDLRVQSKFPSPLFPKKPNHPLQTSTSHPNPHPLKWHQCPDPARHDRPTHHQNQTTAPPHTPVPHPPTAFESSACKTQQAPPTTRGTSESESPPAVSPAQTHLCARVLVVGPHLERSQRWSGLS